MIKRKSRKKIDKTMNKKYSTDGLYVLKNTPLLGQTMILSWKNELKEICQKVDVLFLISTRKLRRQIVSGVKNKQILKYFFFFKIYVFSCKNLFPQLWSRCFVNL